MPLKKNYSSFVVLYRVSIKSVYTIENFNFICAHGLYGHPVYESRSFTYESAEVRNANREQSRTVVIGARIDVTYRY